MSDTQNLFILAGVWTLIAAFLVLLIPKWPAKVIVFALLVGIPFWELPYGYFNFRTLCGEQGGLRVFEAIAPQNSVCLKYPIDHLAPQFLGLGVQFVEKYDRSGGAIVLGKGAAQSPRSSTAYCVAQGFVQGLPWRIQRNEYLVVRAADSRVVARFSDFVWFGTWWQEASLPILGRGGECRHGDPLPPIVKFITGGTN